MTVFDDMARAADRTRDRLDRFSELPIGTRVRFEINDGLYGAIGREVSGEIVAVPTDDRRTYRVLAQKRPGSGHFIPFEVGVTEIIKVTRKAPK